MDTIRKDWIYFVATGFGLGRLPRAPGTWGSLGAVLFYLLLAPWIGLYGQILVALFWCVLGLWSSERIARRLDQKDPQEVVIDEIAGQWIALLGLYSLGGVFLSFVVFRLLDIYKPPPIRQADSLPGAWGIMADDILAGLFTNLLVSLVNRLF